MTNDKKMYVNIQKKNRNKLIPTQVFFHTPLRKKIKKELTKKKIYLKRLEKKNNENGRSTKK